LDPVPDTHITLKPSLLRLFGHPGEVETRSDSRILSGAKLKAKALLMALGVDVLILLTLRYAEGLSTRAVEVFCLINMTALSLDLALTWGLQRKPHRWFHVVEKTCTALECFTVLVWVQLTGTTSSYFIACGGFLILIYRMYASWGTAFTALLAITLFHVTAVVLEEAGVLPRAPLFIEQGPPEPVSYRFIAMSSIFSLYAMMFGAANVIRRGFKEKDEQIIEARRELAVVEEVARHGRLTGTRLGVYKLGEVIGRGGMGEVYQGEHQVCGARVAIKVLHPHLVDDPNAAIRLRREAENAARVPGAHAPAVLDAGIKEGQQYLVMEYLRGEDLAAFLRRHVPLKPDQVVQLITKVAVALDAVHAAGITHRDLKPQNVFLVDGEQARVCLLDFGISKLLEGTPGQTLTRTEALLGTPGYMAPEQARGEPDVGPAADRFALAVIAYYALVGRRPFEAQQLFQALHQVLNTEAVPPTHLVAGLARAVDGVFERALAKGADQRYPRAQEFARALERAFEGTV
jgi:tRNA A-37 threonylcarbamoyl transferase component Bud32